MILLAMLSLSVIAQEQKTIAVYVTGEPTAIKKVLGDKLAAAFARSSEFIAVERTTDFLALVNAEQKYQESGSTKNIAEMGEQLGAQLVCVVDLTDIFDEVYISTRLVDVKNVQITQTADANSKLNNMDAILAVSRKLTDVLIQGLVTDTDPDKMFQEAFKKGYVKIGHLYITTSYGWASKQMISTETTIGGYSDWRLPSMSEYRFIYGVLQSYYAERAKYSTEAKMNIEKLWKEFEYYNNGQNSYHYKYWVKEGYMCEGSSGSYIPKESDERARVMLVRDVNK